jgi:hypothetical protein
MLYYNYTGYQLTGIIYIDGKSISYAYNLENKLISATKIYGYKVKYINLKYKDIYYDSICHVRLVCLLLI